MIHYFALMSLCSRPAMKIAILDFDLFQAESVCDILASIGHECHPFRSSMALLQRFSHEPYDVLVLNMQHPEEETNLVEAVRKQMPAAMPILCITGSANEDEIVASLAAGADDYMFRPIRRRELVIRVLVLLRRAYPSQTDGEQLQFGPYIFEPRRGRLTIMGKTVDVTRKEFDLALLFLRNVGQPLSRTFIVETIWGGNPPEMSRTMDTHVSRVRNKLGLVPGRGFRLAPVYGFGYRLDQVKPTTD
jgi:DNA-binding response OmpR family regulator